jgi:cytochrome c oxidase subunit 3
MSSQYFIPEPSKWPIVGSLALLLLGLGAALWVNSLHIGMWLVGLGSLVLVYMLWGWFKDVVQESVQLRYGHQVDVSFRWGMSWFIFSEVMFFAAFFGALFYVRVITVPELGNFEHKILWPDFIANWPLSVAPVPPKPYEVVSAMGLPALNTLILLSSGATITWAHWGVLAHKRKQLITGLALTVGLGALFLFLQMHEYIEAWTHLNLRLSSGVYGATFYMMTGFHGLHVFIGTVILFVILCRAIAGHFTADNHFGFEAAAWYWHFVDVVWLILFIFVYWI